MDRIITGVDPVTGAVVSGLGSGITAAMTMGAEATQVFWVGVFGAVLYLLKTCDLKSLKSQPIKKLMGLPYRIASPTVLAAIVYYAGTDGFNSHFFKAGDTVWLLVGLAVAMNNDVAFEWIKRWGSRFIQDKTGVKDE